MTTTSSSRALRTVALVAPHFPPSNLASVHRARLLSQHLEEFGWKPIIVTTDWRFYEEQLDWDLSQMVPEGLEIVSTPALSTRPLRMFGDIGLRGFAWHRAALQRLIDSRRVDFVHITVPSFYSALLGQALYAKAPFAFGIDYIDPWVHMWPEAEKPLTKAWMSAKLAKLLEPIAVKHASLITGVAPGYYAGVLERHPELTEHCAVAAMPYGNSELDYAAALKLNKRPFIFDPRDGLFHMVYAGALLPKAWGVLRRFLEGVAKIKRDDPDLYSRLRLHFIGTGKSPLDAMGHNVKPLAALVGVGDAVSEHPHRMAYADVLTHLASCSAPFIIGSTEAHYTPSKVFQAVQSKRPVFALLHEASTAIDVLNRSGAGHAISLTEERMPTEAEVAQRLTAFVAMTANFSTDAVDWSAFQTFSARESARLMAMALDEGAAAFEKRRVAACA